MTAMLMSESPGDSKATEIEGFPIVQNPVSKDHWSLGTTSRTANEDFRLILFN